MNSISVPAVMLHRMLTAVLPHTGLDETLPALTNVRFDVQGATLILEATDRYTMGVARCGIRGEADDQSALLPRKSAKALRKMLRDVGTGDRVTIAARRLAAQHDAHARMAGV